MNSVLESEPKNLENELLKGLRNQTAIGKIQNQIVKKSDILPHIQVLTNPGDVLKIIGLKSNRPKEFSWDYDQKKFGPGETVTHKAEITDKDKLIFYTVFSEPIEKIAVGDKVSETVAKQGRQVAYDIADHYDEEFTQNYACDLGRYHKDAIVKLNADDLRDIQKVGEIAITTGYRMASPSTLFNKREERCNVKNTKKLLCFIDNSLYGRGEVSSIYKSPSPTLEALERNFTVIKCNMVNNVKLALIDADAIYLWTSLNERCLFKDGYVACHKLLDHIWRKWIFVDYRPAFCIVYDESSKSTSSGSIISSSSPKKNILKDYEEISDKSKKMTEAQAKEWNNFSFSYEQVKDWIAAGLECGDAKFANWMVNTKAKSDTKFKDYADPAWCLNNLGTSPHKSVADLKTEAGSL